MTAKNQLTVIDAVKKMEPEFKMALPKHIPAERFTRNAVTVINSNPDLLSSDIDRRSLYASVMKAAQDGLVLDNREAALVTFKTKDGKQVQYMPMVAGILKKMRNTGEIATISTGLVYQNEFDQGRFEYIKGDTESLRHEPILFGDKGELIGVYAVVTLKDGSKVREFMDMKQIDKVKASSRSKNSDYGPWNKWFEEMCLKSVLRRVSKLCPMTSDLDNVFASDDAAEPEKVDQELPQEPIEKKQTKAASKVKGQKPPPVEADEPPPYEEDIIDVEVEEEDLPA